MLAEESRPFRALGLAAAVRDDPGQFFPYDQERLASTLGQAIALLAAELLEHEVGPASAWAHGTQPKTPGEREPASSVEHPAHYGGAGNPYEAILVIEAWGLGFNLGNAVKYISRAGKKHEGEQVTLRSIQEYELRDLEKAAWYLQREIETKRAAL